MNNTSSPRSQMGLSNVLSPFLFIFLFLFLFLITDSISAQNDNSLEWISVKGNVFVNESGETLIFRGVNIRDPHDIERDGHWEKAHFLEAKNWGANVIRLPIHPLTWRERGEEE